MPVVTVGRDRKRACEKRREPARRSTGMKERFTLFGEWNLETSPLMGTELLGPLGRSKHGTIHAAVTEQMQLENRTPVPPCSLHLRDQLGLSFNRHETDDSVGVGFPLGCSQGARCCGQLRAAGAVQRCVSNPNHRSIDVPSERISEALGSELLITCR